MKKSDLIKDLLGNFETEKALQIAKKLDLNVQNLISNPVFLRAFFQNLLTETRFYKEEVHDSQGLTTIANVHVAKRLFQTLASVETQDWQGHSTTANLDEYPEHYPIVLQELMIDARRKIAHKQFLSNSLNDLLLKKANTLQTVKQILTLETQIDEIYADKKYFDLHMSLPAKYSKYEIPDTEKKDLQKEYNNLKANISKTKAKLKNPSEKNKQVLQAKLKEFEQKRMNLAIKLNLQK